MNRPLLYSGAAILLTGVIAASAYLYMGGDGADGAAGYKNLPPELKTEQTPLPKELIVYGRKIDLAEIKNPLGALKGAQKTGQIEAGKITYFKNCVFCHGATLDGDGVHAQSLTQRPADLSAPESIIKLPDDYLFWRIVKGPTQENAQKTKRQSAMPAWESRLSEEQVWQVILFLRDFVGQLKSVKQDKPANYWSGENLYKKYCTICHGPEGDGLGKAADYFDPHPRDFTIAEFKFRSSGLKAGLPADADLVRIIREGLPGTGMTSWKKILSDQQIKRLVHYIKKFGEWEDSSVPVAPMSQMPTRMLAINRGRELFLKVCETCHGVEGRGNVTSNKKLKDNWGYRVWPRNLTRPDSFRWVRNVEEIFRQISIGIPGTPMPEHASTLSPGERWAIAKYVFSLSRNAPKSFPAQAVIRGQRVKGELPLSPIHPMWHQAKPQFIRLLPNLLSDPPQYFGLNDLVQVRALHNGSQIAMKIEVDDRTFSVPGDFLERRHALGGVKPTSDAIAVRFLPALKDGGLLPALWIQNSANTPVIDSWYWRAPNRQLKRDQTVREFPWSKLSAGSDTPKGTPALVGKGVWRKGQWRIVFRRDLKPPETTATRFPTGRYLPISFVNWDGWAGQINAKHSLSEWHWLYLEDGENTGK